MSRLFLLLSVLAMVAFTFGLSGCDTAQDTTPAEQGADSHAGHNHAAGEGHTDDADDGHDRDAEDADAHAGQDHGDMDNSKVEAALAELSADDQAAARAQKTCPVSKELLGLMGTPYKVTVHGKDVFLCCQGCEAEIKANPEKYGL